MARQYLALGNYPLTQPTPCLILQSDDQCPASLPGGDSLGTNRPLLAIGQITATDSDQRRPSFVAVYRIMFAAFAAARGNAHEAFRRLDLEHAAPG